MILVASALCVATGIAAAHEVQDEAHTNAASYADTGYQGMYAPEPTSAGEMSVDTFLVRPASLAASVAGTGIFIISLPFSILGGNVKQAANELIVEPTRYTFDRPLGYFPESPGDDIF